jgi:hypothetical protein
VNLLKLLNAETLKEKLKGDKEVPYSILSPLTLCRTNSFFDESDGNASSTAFFRQTFL